MTTVHWRREGKVLSGLAYVQCDRCTRTYSWRPYAGSDEVTNARRFQEALSREGWDVEWNANGSCLCWEHKEAQDA